MNKKYLFILLIVGVIIVGIIFVNNWFHIKPSIRQLPNSLNGENEIIEKVSNEQKKNQTPEGEIPEFNPQQFIEDGTYVISIQDEIIDPYNGNKIIFEKEGIENEKSKLYYSAYFPNNSYTYINKDYSIFESETKSNLYYPPGSMAPGEYTKDGVFLLTYNKKINPNLFNVSIDFCPRTVFMKAKGDKKILVLPIYFEDFADKIDGFDEIKEHIYLDAFDEINQYLHVKQLEYLGKEVMTFNFTISKPILAQNPHYYYDNGVQFDIPRRFDLVKEKTIYNPLNYDITVFIFYTEQINTSHAWAHLVLLTKPPEATTELDIINPGIIHSQRNYYTKLLFHEILHNFGMTDENETQLRRECYIGDKFDGTQTLFVKNCDPSVQSQNNDNVGSFQLIDSFVANEIGWSDRNKNGIMDYEEYCITCWQDFGEYKFCSKKR